MKRRSFVASAATLMLSTGRSPLAASALEAAEPARTAEPAADPAIAAMLAAISPARMHQIVERLVASGTRSTYSERSADPHRGVHAARAFLVDSFTTIARTSGGRMSVSLDTYVRPRDERIVRDVEVSSVVATLRGSDPAARTYVIGSHYDSRNSNNDDGERDAPGADDNASAVACVLEAARVMASTRFAGTVIFACYDGEEQGLLGSDHHARLLKSRGVNVEAMLNNDIIGASRGPAGESTPNEVRIFSEALAVGATARSVNARASENDSNARELARFAKATGEIYSLPVKGRLVYHEDRFRRGGDQESFAAQGFPAIRFVEPHENFDHQHQDVRIENGRQYGDLIQFMDFEYLAHVAAMNVASLATLAAGPGRPQNVKMLVHELSYDSTLHWDPLPGALFYEVAVRENTSPLWQETWPFASTRATVPRNKDDFIFGVRAVDAAGHRTPATFPDLEV